MSAAALDHVGIVGRDLGVLAAAYEGLGFTLSPHAQHHAPGPDGVVRPLGTGNRCAMLGRGYVELIAIVDPALPSNTLDRFLARHAGAHILAFAIDDAEGELARLRAVGHAIPGIACLERPVGTKDGVRTARFARLPLPASPEGRVQLIQHLTPELLWQPHLIEHANRAVSLDAVIVAVADPDEASARLAPALGGAPEPVPGGVRIRLGRGELSLVTAEAAARLLPGLAVPSLPFIAGLVIGTDDGARAAAAIAGHRARAAEAGLLVPPSDAGGAAILFV
jgi:hypothetical protein